jgi:phosphoglycerate dehydrogenase-like enzyme
LCLTQDILNSSKVLLSPHVGGWTNESYFKLSDVLLQKIKEQANPQVPKQEETVQ